MKNLRKFSVLLFSAILAGNLFISCDNEDLPKGDYTDGVYITNEGSFGRNNGSISFYNYSSDSVINNVFELVNNRILGDVVQSTAIDGNNLFIVVNNSNKVEVADKNTLEEQGVIEGLLSPRYMLVDDNFGYISCWGDNSVKVVDLSTFAINNTIYSNGSGPDKMLISDKKLYILNSGGWGTDSTVTVVNTNTGEIIKNIKVPTNPKDIVRDKSGFIWVLSYGNEIWDSIAVIGHTPSMLYKIDPATNEVIASGELFAEQHPAQLEIDNDGSTLYVGGGYTFSGIYKITVSGSNLTLNKIIDDFAYGLNYDSNSGVLFVALSGNYTSGGTLKRYTTDGTLLGTYTCGIGTSAAAFKRAD